MVRLARSGSTRRGWTGGRALAAYVVVAFLFFGVRLFLYPGETYVGFEEDPQIFIWSFAWWPHAILHGLNPFVTHAIWAPTGVNLTWTTSMPGLSIAFAPLTLIAGPVVAYDAAAILMPALAAWTAWLLCRRLTGSGWASIAGGYLFGFSSYILGQEEGHLHMTAAFLVPLVVLVLVRYLAGELGRGGLVIRLGLLLAAQLTLSTELAFTLTLAVAAALLVGYLLAPARRGRLRSLALPLAGSYLLAAVLAAPFLYYLFAGFQTDAFQPPGLFVADLLNFVVPTHLEVSGAWWSHVLARSFPGNDAERGAFLGPAVLAIVCLFAWGFRRTARGRVLLVLLGLGVLAALGSALYVDGHRLFWLPWDIVGSLPVFDNTLPVRFTLYISLVVAVIVALWAASPAWPVWLRRALPALACLAIVPNPAAGTWVESLYVPAFFTSAAYRSCLARGEIVLPLPISGEGDQMSWQAENGFRFAMAGGHIAATAPPEFMRPDVAVIGTGQAPPQDTSVMQHYVDTEHVTAILVDERLDWMWRPLLDQIATPQDLGGVLVYRVAGSSTPRGCPDA